MTIQKNTVQTSQIILELRELFVMFLISVDSTTFFKASIHFNTIRKNAHSVLYYKITEYSYITHHFVIKY